MTRRTPHLDMTPLTLAAVPASLRVEEQLFELALDACPQAISIVDVRHPEQPLVYVNHAFELLTGYERAAVLGRNCRFLQGQEVDELASRRFRQAIREGGPAIITLRNFRKDGSAFANELFLEAIRDRDGTVTHFVGLQTDVSERDRRRGEARSAFGLRQRHALTGRGALDERITRSLARASAVGTRCALFLIELSAPAQPGQDVDTLARDRLAEVAVAIGEAVPEAGVGLCGFDASRLALLLDPAPMPAELTDVARRVLAAASHRLSTRDAGASCHVGIAMGPADGASPQDLALAARRALDRARLRSPAGEISFFANAQDARLLYLRDIEADLAEAIAKQQFTLVYQPIVQLDTAHIVGFEALIRWTHPVRGPVPPSEFIPVAEASGMILQISDWVIDTALAQLAAFDAVSAQTPHMFINLSASQFENPGFVDSLRAKLQRYKIKPGRVELEITERTVTDTTPATLQTLHALRQLGVSLAIDDFGTGYSNLHNLTQLPIDTLKIDMSFTHGVTHSAAAASVSRMICELGRMLELKVVVEGIETEGQLNHFRELSCPYGQGYLFSKPVVAEAACAMLRTPVKLFAAVPQGELPHLLLLDDEENILSSLRRLLRREGYRIHSTSSPEVAFEILATHPVGVVVSDQRMPQMNGTEFLRQVKKLYPQTVRMVLSGYSELAAVTEAVNEGAIWKFLSKPWDDAALREQIRLAFDEHKNLRETAQRHASALHGRARLESAVSQRDEQLAMEMRALESARDAMSMLPIPVVGVDPSLMIVMSNLEADRLLGGGASLMGEWVAGIFPAQVADAIGSLEATDVQLAGQDFRLHSRALGESAQGQGPGHLLCFVPRSPP